MSQEPPQPPQRPRPRPKPRKPEKPTSLKILFGLIALALFCPVVGLGQVVFVILMGLSQQLLGGEFGIFPFIVVFPVSYVLFPIGCSVATYLFLNKVYDDLQKNKEH